MSWINKILPSISTSSLGGKNKSSVPEGIWKKCPRCDATLYRGDLERNADVCPKCDHHLRITARRRLQLFLDEKGQVELFDDIEPVDILKFKDLKKYKDRLSAAQKNTGEKDALIVCRGTVTGVEMVVAAFEFGFIGGSMGAVVGEKFTRAVNTCIEEQLPLVCFSTSGGARMQEALVSLMQMAKTSAALARLRERNLPFISVLVDPVYGGVSASLAMMGDINIAEPNALVGFTGPDVIRQTVRVKLPEGFQRSEFLLEHGAIDMIVHRKKLRERIASLIGKLMNNQIQAALSPAIADEVASASEEIVAETEVEELTPQDDKADEPDPEVEETAQVESPEEVEPVPEPEFDETGVDSADSVSKPEIDNSDENAPESEEQKGEAEAESDAPREDKQPSDADGKK